MAMTNWGRATWDITQRSCIRINECFGKSAIWFKARFEYFSGTNPEA
jgi:hypothetical protein